MTYIIALLDVTVLLKEELMIYFTFWKLSSDPFPVVSLITTFLIRHYLWNLMHGLKHYQELGDMCQQDVISLSFWAAAVHSYLPACLPDYKWKDRPSRKHGVRTPGLFYFQKNLVLYFFTNRACLFTDSLLNKTSASDYDVPDTPEQNNLWPGGAHRAMEKADLNQTVPQINNNFQTLMMNIKENYRAPWTCVIGNMTLLAGQGGFQRMWD